MKLFEIYDGFGHVQGLVLATSMVDAHERFLVAYEEQYGNKYPYANQLPGNLKEIKFNQLGINLPAGNWDDKAAKSLDVALEKLK